MNIVLYSEASAYSPQRFGGAETSMRLIGEMLAWKGHSVTYITRSSHPRVVGWTKRALMRRVEVVFLPKFKGVHRSGIIRRLDRARTERLLLKWLRRRRPDIVYCFYNRKTVLRLAELRNRLPERSRFHLVLRMAGLHWLDVCRKNPNVKPVYERMFANADAFNFLNERSREMSFEALREIGLDASLEPSFVGDIGTRVEPGRPVAYPAHSEPEFRLVMASRFTWYQKRQDILVRAIAELGDDIPVTLDLYGDGEKRAEIENLVEELGVSHRVRVASFLSQDALWKKLLSVDLLVHACDHEGLPKVMVEAMALGVPCLVSNVSPLNALIEDGSTGFLVNNEPAEWAERLRVLYFNETARRRVSAAAIEHIRSRYNPYKNVDYYETAFSKLLEASPQ